MFCHKCGTKLNVDSRFCYKCGNKVVVPDSTDIDNAVKSDELTGKENEQVPQHETQPELHVTPPSNPAESSRAVSAVKDDDKFDVVLIEARAVFMRPVIATVKEVTGLGEQESKSLIENIPSVLKKSISKSEAMALMNKFSNVDAIVEVVSAGMIAERPAAPSKTDEPFEPPVLSLGKVIKFIFSHAAAAVVAVIFFGLLWGVATSLALIIVHIFMNALPKATSDKRKKLQLRLGGVVGVAIVIVGCSLLHLNIINNSPEAPLHGTRLFQIPRLESIVGNRNGRSGVNGIITMHRPGQGTITRHGVSYSSADPFGDVQTYIQALQNYHQFFLLNADPGDFPDLSTPTGEYFFLGRNASTSHYLLVLITMRDNGFGITYLRGEGQIIVDGRPLR